MRRKDGAHSAPYKAPEDPILEEVRMAREKYVASLNYDLDAIARDLKQREGKSGHKVVSLQPKRLEAEVKE